MMCVPLRVHVVMVGERVQVKALVDLLKRRWGACHVSNQS